MAGASRSGNLKEPSKSIPLGTLSAHLSTTLIYMIMVLLLGTVITGDFLRTKTPTSGLILSSVAWPTSWLTLIGCLFASFGAALQSMTKFAHYFQLLNIVDHDYYKRLPKMILSLY